MSISRAFWHGLGEGARRRLVQHMRGTPAQAQRLAWQLAEAVTTALSEGPSCLAPQERCELAKEALAQATSIGALSKPRKAEAFTAHPLFEWRNKGPVGTGIDTSTGVAGTV